MFEKIVKESNLFKYDEELGMNVEKNFKKYRYDYYVFPNDTFENGLLIEVDGAQHFQKEKVYTEQEKMGGLTDFSLSEEDFFKQVVRDQLKNLIATRLDIPIIRVSTLDKVREQIQNVLTNKEFEFNSTEYYKPLLENIQNYKKGENLKHFKEDLVKSLNFA